MYSRNSSSIDLSEGPHIIWSLILWISGGAGLVIVAVGPFHMETTRSLMDLMTVALIGAHVVYAGMIYRNRRMHGTGIDLLFVATAVVFLFSYIYASNANMDYVQRFAEGKTYLNFGPDSRIERLNSLFRFLPLLMGDAVVSIKCGLFKRADVGTIQRFGLWFSLASALLVSFAFPSFADAEGWGFLAWVSLVPLLLVLLRVPTVAGVLYLTWFGVIHTMITSFWLGTFSLVTLQLVTVVYLVLFALFSRVVMWVIHRRGDRAVWIFPLLWVVFDYLRSTGFAGYPWGMIGTTQYRFLPVIQIAEITGVWGVTALVVLVNAAIAQAILSPERWIRPISIAAGCVGAILLFGAFRIARIDSIASTGERTTVALIQQNNDPRKDDYADTLEVLKRLTNEAMKSDPALVVWSETAFVPNIRRWSRLEPWRSRLARVVRDFLTYQESLETWLITGNDDYEVVTDDSGAEINRLNYNAAVLFDDRGERIETYRKMHLVPFTEYFPFRESMPGAYEALKNFDVYLWEPGDRRVVFEHPDFTFSTPICFEDSFPRDVRLFVRAGAGLIINLSNDYWSLREAEAGQHFANALFRAVENRRELLRATASGVTARVDAAGRVVDSLPDYVEASLVVEPSLAAFPTTIYTRLGDWFPLVAMGVVIGALLLPRKPLETEPGRVEGAAE